MIAKFFFFLLLMFSQVFAVTKSFYLNTHYYDTNVDNTDEMLALPTTDSELLSLLIAVNFYDEFYTGSDRAESGGAKRKNITSSTPPDEDHMLRDSLEKWLWESSLKFTTDIEDESEYARLQSSLAPAAGPNTPDDGPDYVNMPDVGNDYLFETAPGDTYPNGNTGKDIITPSAPDEGDTLRAYRYEDELGRKIDKPDSTDKYGSRTDESGDRTYRV